MSISDMYSQKILEIAGRLEPANRLDGPDASARKVSRVCGSGVEIDLNMSDGKVSAYGHDINACAMGQTSSSVMAQHIVGSTGPELRSLRNQMHEMLKNNGLPPEGKWEDLKYLQAVRDFPPRHASTMLIFDAVVECLDQIEAKS